MQNFPHRQHKGQHRQAHTNQSVNSSRQQLPMSRSDREFEEYREAFDYFDANSDGYITTQELEMAMSKCGVYPSKLELNLVMLHGDADGNGMITIDEFIQLMEIQQSRRKYDVKELREQFRMFDKDRDGYIELNEMVQIVSELSLGRYFPIEVVERLFREADIDNDGKISFAEFVMSVN